MRVSKCLYLLLGLAFSSVSAWGEDAQVGYSCSKASSVIERTICADADLSAKDAELNALFGEVRESSDADHRKTLLHGQRAWLKLRSTACLIENMPLAEEQRASCLMAVYQDRIGQFRLERANQQKHLAGKAPLFDIEAVLDEERDLAAYSPKTMSAIRPRPHEGEVVNDKDEIIPKTCRELFTLTAGQWGYGGDTIGENSKGTAVTQCLFAAYRSQNYRLSPHDKDISFSDQEKYSSEFACLPIGCRTGSGYERSFHLRKLKALQHDAHREKGKGRGRDHLYLDGMNYNLTISAAGDYSGKGRDEAIIAIDYYPDVGTLRGHLILLAYFDPVSGFIRPEEVDDEAGLELKLVEEGSEK